MCAESPDVLASIPRPGSVGSTVLPTGAIGIRRGRLQVMPSDDEDKTRSSMPVLQRNSDRQSGQVTYTLPDPSMLAETRPPPRRLYGGMPPFGPKKTSCPTRDGLLQVWPPSVDLIDRTVVSKQSEMGMTTVPLGCTSGWPPITQVSSGVVL